MSSFIRGRAGRRGVAGVSVLLALAFVAPSLFAADKTDSLDWVPEDAAFYSSSRRLGEQVKILMASNAVKKLKEIPALKMGLAMLETQLDDPSQPAGMVKAFFELPENKQLLELMADMHSHEIAMYGGDDWIDAFQMLQELNTVSNQVQADQIRRLQEFRFDEPDAGESAEQEMGRRYLDFLKGNLDRCKVPTTVFAFRLSEKVPAETQLKRLEVIAKVAFAHVEQLKDAISHKKIGDTDYLTFTFEAKHLPWDELPLEGFEKEEGEYKKVFDHLKSLKVVANLGVWNNWLVVSISATDEHLVKLGEGKTLAERAEMAKLAPYRDKRLTSVGYASERFMKEASDWRSQIDDLVEMAKAFLPLAELPEKLNDRITADIEELGTDIKEELPMPGAYLGLSYLTKDGFEFRSFDWSNGSAYDSSKPLPILNHVGGSPILAIAARAKYKPEQYDTLRKWVKKGHAYFEEFALPQLSDRERKQYETVAEKAYPLIRRLDTTTEKKLIPALADGQSALVIDAKLTSPQWVKEMPRAASPLAIPEMALVMGVSDAKLLKEAMVDYHSIANDIVKAAREISPDEIPPFEIPLLTGKKLADGTMYYFPIPAELYEQAGGLDRRLLPNLGLSKTVGTIGMSEDQTERLLKSTPLKTGGPLAKVDRNAAMAVYFNWAGMVDAAKPWVDYGFAVAAMEGEFGPLPEGGEGSREDVSSVKLPPPAQMILSQVHFGLEFAKCIRTFEGVIYKDDAVWVSEGRLHIVDMKP
ncbi:MAG: hypothetical protein MI757_12805 [Pirellulales bacterium]|nr:hypothetical protein [Pirellulales bacterium]